MASHNKHIGWYVAGASVVLVGGYFLIRKKKNNPPPPYPVGAFQPTPDKPIDTKIPTDTSNVPVDSTTIGYGLFTWLYNKF